MTLYDALGREVIISKPPSGIGGAGVVEIGDSQRATQAHVSHFGALKTSAATPVIEGNFPGTALDATQWTKTEANGATVTVASGVGSLQCGTNSAGTVTLRSVRAGRFLAGQVTTFQSGVYAGTGLANNVRRWGLMTSDGLNGLFFQWNGTTFQVVARKNGTDTTVDQSSFSGETTWSPSAANNTYRIDYSAGRALFMRASSGNPVLLHTMTRSDYPLVDTLDLGLYFENTNSGNTTNVEMRVRGASVSIFGSQERHNRWGAKVVTDFGTEAAFGETPDFQFDTVFGRASGLSLGTATRDVWNGGGAYTGLNATANENMQVFSSVAADAGGTRKTGTATGGTDTTLVDSGADFVTTSGVVVGDILVNDTIGAHGYITAVTATTVTVWNMVGIVGESRRNSAGHAYRIVYATSTGAALVRITEILDSAYTMQTPKYAVLNGTTGVTVTANAMRCKRGEIVKCGSGDANAGTITCRQATTTANVFFVMPVGYNRTLVSGWTVPAGREALVKRFRAALTRTNGSAGSATVSFRVRRRGECFVSRRVFELQTGGPTSFDQIGGVYLTAGTDIKFKIDDVSDNSSTIETAVEVSTRNAS